MAALGYTTLELELIVCREQIFPKQFSQLLPSDCVNCDEIFMGWSPTVKSLVPVKNRGSNIIIFRLFVILFLNCNLSGAEDVSK